MTIAQNGSFTYIAALQAAMDESRVTAAQELRIRTRRDVSSSSSSSSSSLSVCHPQNGVHGGLTDDEMLQTALNSLTANTYLLSALAEPPSFPSSPSPTMSSTQSTSHLQGIRRRIEQYRNVMSLNSVRLLEDSLAIINQNNQRHTANAPAAIIIQATSFTYHALGDASQLILLEQLKQLEQLTKTHYVALQIIGSRDTLGDTIREIQRELVGHPIMTAIIMAHGAPNAMDFGDSNGTNFYQYPTASDFAPLEPHASIVFVACSTGQDLARRVAALQPRHVFACIDRANSHVFTPCCDKHGYGLIALNGYGEMIARRFEQQNGCVIESNPCCATPSRIAAAQQQRLTLPMKLYQNLELPIDSLESLLHRCPTDAFSVSLLCDCRSKIMSAICVLRNEEDVLGRTNTPSLLQKVRQIIPRLEDLIEITLK